MLKIYNSLTQQKEIFKPLHPPRVTLYVCGITVYDYCHLGHARLVVAFDVVARALRYLGFDLTYVKNITDIDDKIIRRAQEKNETWSTLTERFIQAAHEDEAALSVQPPDQEPRATAYIADMITIIQTLIDKGLAYVARSGDVCFEVRQFKSYGALSKRDLNELRAGERVEIVDDKRDPLDFVLWKMAKPDEPAWDSPWGKGRPGWHIECSAMSWRCTGVPIDIHGGGMDLMFPHHENERAQTEGALEKTCAGIWMHLGFLNINKEKMSKSLNNFFTIRELLKKYDAESLRYFLLASHYRKPLNYDIDASIPQATQALTRFYTALRGLPVVSAPLDTAFESAFKVALEDDFNTPDALAVLFDLVREINRLKAENKTAEAGSLGALLKKLSRVLGILQRDPEDFFKVDTIDEREIEALIQKRNAARLMKNFKEADAIRGQLRDYSIEIEDTAQGTTWRRLRDCN